MKKSYLLASAVASALFLAGCAHQAPQAETDAKAAEASTPATQTEAPAQTEQTAQLDAPLCLAINPNIPSADLVKLIQAGMEQVIKPVTAFDEKSVPEVCKNAYVMHYGIRAKQAETKPVKGKKAAKAQKPQVVIEAMDFLVARDGKSVLQGEGPAVNGDITAQQVLNYSTNMTKALYDRYTSGQLNQPQAAPAPAPAK
ncbi:MAG: hypothetical protein SOR95_06595 [Sutterella sp.]|nr:hypothetical protein [Sutterella sp.]